MDKSSNTLTVPTALAEFGTQHGTTLAALSDESPILLIFLRHFG